MVVGLNPIAVTFIAAFDYFNKTSIVGSAISKEISIICFVSVTAVPVGITSASFSIASS